MKPSCQGQAYLIRYADDFVCAFQYKDEAEGFYRALPERLAKFSLQVAPEKTCIHRFSRFHPSRKRRFTFLGFEFYWEADSKGEPRVWRRTARKKLRTSINACKEWLKGHRHYPLPKLIPAMICKVRGHYNYFRAIWEQPVVVDILQGGRQTALQVVESKEPKAQSELGWHQAGSGSFRIS